MRIALWLAISGTSFASAGCSGPGATQSFLPPADTALGTDSLEGGGGSDAPDLDVASQPGSEVASDALSDAATAGEAAPDAPQADPVDSSDADALAPPDPGLPPVLDTSTGAEAEGSAETVVGSDTQVQPDVCQPACTGKACGADGCGGECGSCPAGNACSAQGQCVAAACGEVALEIQGELLSSATSIGWSKVAVAILHKLDVDAFEDGCLASIAVTLTQGGCVLSLVASGAYLHGGGLVVHDLELSADSFCAGFSDAEEGLYHDTGGLVTAQLIPSLTEVPEYQAAQACFNGKLTLELGGTLHRQGDGAPLEVTPSTVVLTGDFTSQGDTEVSCPCQPLCDGKVCGPDACGNLCGICPASPPQGTLSCTATGSCELTCKAGHHACEGSCLDDTSVESCGALCTPCTPPPGATATCKLGACGFVCSPGTHACGGACLEDASVASCGSSCNACPTGEVPATCSAGQCGFDCSSCPTPQDATATCAGGACGWSCKPGLHACDDLCASNASPATCGSSCIPCPDPPANGVATCDGAKCGFGCQSGFEACATSCVPAGTCDPCSMTWVGVLEGVPATTYRQLKAGVPRGGSMRVLGSELSWGLAPVEEAWLAQLNEQGDLDWSITQPEAIQFYHGVLAPNDGTFLVGASEDAAGTALWSYVALTGATGDLLWSDTLSALGTDTLSAGLALPNGDYLAVGAQGHAPDANGQNAWDAAKLWVVRLDAAGKLLSNQSYPAYKGGANGIVARPGGGYAVVGVKDAGANLDQAWLALLDANAAPVSQYSYSGGTSTTAFQDVVISGDLLVALGYSGKNAWVKGLDGSGTGVMSAQVAPTGTQAYFLHGTALANGDVLAVGRFDAATREGLVARIQPSGALTWTTKLHLGGHEVFSAAVEAGSGGFLTAGQRWSTGTLDAVSVRLTDAGAHCAKCGDAECTGIETCAGCPGDCGVCPSVPFACSTTAAKAVSGCLITQSYEGCCDPAGQLVWCENNETWCQGCNGLCTWSEANQYYACGTVSYPDPSGANPLSCGD